MQISMFDLAPGLFETERPDEKLYSVLKRGSGFQNGCLRIYAADQQMNQADFVAFLRDEFGIGGHSIGGGFVDYDSRGLKIRYWCTDEEYKYTWEHVSKAYRKMIASGEFPETRVREEYRMKRQAGKGIPTPRFEY